MAEIYRELEIYKESDVAELAIFYGSDEGNTEHIAERIRARLGEEVCDIFDIGDVTQLNFTSCQISSQSDWSCPKSQVGMPRIILP